MDKIVEDKVIVVTGAAAASAGRSRCSRGAKARKSS